MPQSGKSAAGSPQTYPYSLHPGFSVGHESLACQIQAEVQKQLAHITNQMLGQLQAQLEGGVQEIVSKISLVETKCNEFQERSAEHMQMLEDRITNVGKETSENISTSQHLYWQNEIAPWFEEKLEKIREDLGSQIQEIRDGKTNKQPAPNDQQQKPNKTVVSASAKQTSPKPQPSVKNSGEPSPALSGPERKRAKTGNEKPICPSPHKQDLQDTKFIGGFFAHLAMKRLFKLVTKYGTVLSLRRYGRGWAVATMQTADQAKAALQLNGHWGTAKRIGVKVSLWEPRRPLRPDEGEEFMGSDCQRRMKSATTADGNVKSATEGKPAAQNKPGQQGENFRKLPESNVQLNTPSARPGKRLVRDSPHQAHAEDSHTMQTDSSDITASAGDEAHTGEQPESNGAKGRGGASPPDQRRKKQNSKAKAGGGSGSRNNSSGQGRSSPPPNSHENPFTEQEIRAKFYFRQDGGVWIPGASYLDQKLRGETPPRQVKNVPGDGHCQSRALVATGQTKYSDFQALKEDARNYLEANTSLVHQHLLEQHLIQPGDDGWKGRLLNHLQASSGPQAFGDEISIGLYAMLLQTEIQVLDAFDGSLCQKAKPLSADSAQDGHGGMNIPVAVGYRRHKMHRMYDKNFKPTRSFADGHYWAILPLQGNGGRSG